jgi:hypothetical protein
MPTTDDVLGELLTEAQAAELLNCSVQQLRRWRKTGVGPHYRKLANCPIRYARPDLSRFVDDALTKRTGWKPARGAL